MSVDFPVPLHVSFNLGDPEGSVGLDFFSAGPPIMAVPKGAIDENQQFVFNKGDIRFSRKLPLIATITEACIPNGFFEKYLGLGVVPFDFGHVARPLFGSIKAIFFTKFGNRYF